MVARGIALGGSGFCFGEWRIVNGPACASAGEVEGGACREGQREGLDVCWLGGERTAGDIERGLADELGDAFGVDRGRERAEGLLGIWCEGTERDGDLAALGDARELSRGRDARATDPSDSI